MNSDYKWYVLQSAMKRERASELLSAFDRTGVEAVLIKGLAVERFYPEEMARPAFDIDIAVDPEMYPRVLEGFKSGEFGSQDADIHEGLRHFDTRNWSTVFAKSKLVDICGSNLRVLSEEDQLRVTCIHWLTDGGERKDRLADIHFLVQNRPSEFDWDYALNADGTIRRGWILAAIGAAERYTDLEIGSLPFAEEAKTMPVWMIDSLERSWSDDVRFMPLDTYFKDPLNFARQLKRRFPPNPIMSTVMTEGEFDAGGRLKHQIAYFAQRAGPSFKRSLKTLMNLLKAPK